VELRKKRQQAFLVLLLGRKPVSFICLYITRGNSN
jgi:hypothetical protein